ncbi:MAG: class I SAM-dependent DNA methyltransferase [Gemmatimonadales bacterium]
MSGEPTPPATAEFDAFAESYDRELEAGLAIAGENKLYFARGRLQWLSRRLRELDSRPETVLDFGCGDGVSAPLIFELVGAKTLLGVDLSDRLLEIARSRHGYLNARFLRREQAQPDGRHDLAFCNGVLHHIQPGERPGTLEYVHRFLRPGGLFALWENNPWNPGTRYIMSRVSFDRDAITLTAPEARRMLRAAGFEVLHTDFLFVFPRWLRGLRPLEPMLAGLPLGGQYQVLCRRA